MTRPLRFSDAEHTHISVRAHCDGSTTPRSAGHALEPCVQAPKTAYERRRPPRAAAREPCDHRGRGAAAATAQRFTSRIRRAGDVLGEVDVSPDNDNSRATGSRLRSCYPPRTNGRKRDAKHAAHAKNVKTSCASTKARRHRIRSSPRLQRSVGRLGLEGPAGARAPRCAHRFGPN